MTRATPPADIPQNHLYGLDSHERGVGDSTHASDNDTLARLFDRTADLLERQDANPFRVKAYREAAQELRSLPQSIRRLVRDGGREALLRIPNFGESLSRAAEDWLRTGTLGILVRLEGEIDGLPAAEQTLRSLPGLGPELAARIHRELGISTLEELEIAAHDGRLDRVQGIGARRVRSIRDQLEGRFRLERRERTGEEDPSRPPVQELLDVDREYREKADAGTLPRIAPRRFNPTHETWLPILHTDRGERHYTVLFSNTALSHRLGKTHDWVVIFLDDGKRETRWTVVTETRGPLRGRRVVRGRERECQEL